MRARVALAFPKRRRAVERAKRAITARGADHREAREAPITAHFGTPVVTSSDWGRSVGFALSSELGYSPARCASGISAP